MKKDKENDGRYPYTYAADLIRHWAGCGERGMKISRSDASKIRRGISGILGMDDDELANKLADYYLDNQEEITQEGIKELLPILIDTDVDLLSDEAKRVLGI